MTYAGGKCSRLVYLVFLTYLSDFSFFSVTAKIFDVTCCILTSLVVFSNSVILIVLIPSYRFPSLNWVTKLRHNLAYGYRETMHTKK